MLIPADLLDPCMGDTCYHGRSFSEPCPDCDDLATDPADPP